MTKPQKIDHPALLALDARRRAMLKVLRAIAGMEPREAREILQAILASTPERERA